MNGLWQDARYAVRSLRRSPGLTTIVITTLSVGIFVVTTFFSLLNAALFRPLPFPDADRIVMIQKPSKSPDYIVGELVKSAKSIERIAVYGYYGEVMTGQGEPVAVASTHVDSGFFPLLRLTPLLGVLPGASDVVAGAPVAVIGEKLWRTQFNADPGAIGRVITLRGIPRRIVAVVKRDFTLPGPLAGVWLPSLDPCGGEGIHEFIVRLSPGATHADVQRDLDLVNARLRLVDPTTFKDPQQFLMRPEMLNRYHTIGYYLQPLKLLIGAAAIVLLIACTNLALLMIARGARRRGEMVVRASLGASRWQLVRQQTVESVLLVGVAGVIGTVFSIWGARLAVAQLVPARIQAFFPGWLDYGVDLRVAGVAIGLSVLIVGIIGVWPARAGTRFNLAGILRSDADHGIAGRDPTRSAHLPIVLQLTLSLALFAGAVMLGLTYRRITEVDRGFDPRGLFEAQVATDQDSTAAGTTMFFRQLRDQLTAMPGVEVSLSSRLESFNGEKTDRAVYLPGARNSVVSPAEWRPDPAVVSDDYFRVMRIPLLAGRPFNRGDVSGSAPVVIVSREFAIRAWGTADAIGKTLVMGLPEQSKSKNPAVTTLATVVGIAGDVRVARLGEVSLVWSRPDAYVSDRQAQFNSASVLVRSVGGPVAVRKAVATAAERAGRLLPVSVGSWEEQTRAGSDSAKALATMMSAFAAVSLGLALIGIYGIVAFSVEQRTREVGIRLALGAQSSDVVRAIMKGSTQLTAIGLALGLVAAVALGKIMSAFVVGAVTSHVAISVVATVLFAFVASLASYIPARRASKLDPVEALRR